MLQKLAAPPQITLQMGGHMQIVAATCMTQCLTGQILCTVIVCCKYFALDTADLCKFLQHFKILFYGSIHLVLFCMCGWL